MLQKKTAITSRFFFTKKVKVHSFIIISFGYQHSHSGGLHARPAALLRRHQTRSSAVFRRFFDTWSWSNASDSQLYHWAENRVWQGLLTSGASRRRWGYTSRMVQKCRGWRLAEKMVPSTVGSIEIPALRNKIHVDFILLPASLFNFVRLPSPPGTSVEHNDSADRSRIIMRLFSDLQAHDLVFRARTCRFIGITL